jgi:hypothetical protein
MCAIVSALSDFQSLQNFSASPHNPKYKLKASGPHTRAEIDKPLPMHEIHRLPRVFLAPDY